MALPKASVGNSASFQIAGTPFVLEATANKTIDFKYITRAVTIQSSGSGTGNKVSFDGGTTTMTLVQNKVYRLDVKCKQMIITRATGTISVVAELTNVQAGQMAAIVQNNYQWIYGCMDSTASNYNANANASDGSCTYTTPDVLFHFDGNFTEACSSDVTASGTFVSDSSGKFTTAAAFASSGGSAFNINTGNMAATNDTNSLHWDGEFTFDVWAKFDDASSAMNLIAEEVEADGDPDGRFSLSHTGTGGYGPVPANSVLLLMGGSGGGNPSVFITASHTRAADTWYHFAVTRDSSDKIRVFVNGVGLDMSDDLGASTAYTTANGFPHAAAINPNKNNTSSGEGYDIGGAAILSGAIPLKGSIDELRIHKGDCLWTADFTPPGVGTC